MDSYHVAGKIERTEETAQLLVPRAGRDAGEVP